MKGIILAGGTGSRLHPLTLVTNKHLLPVNNKPMIFYPIEKLAQAGIKDIMIIIGGNSIGDIVRLIGSGSRFGVNITYRCQDDPDGIAGALKLCEDFVNNDRCIVVLGDNIFQTSLKPIVEEYLKQPEGAKILIKHVSDPQRFGVAEVDRDRVIQVVEKPQNPKSNNAVIGVYMFDAQVFNIVKDLTKSARGEYEVVDIQNAYIKAGTLTWNKIEGWWTDAGSISTLHRASLHAMHDTEEV